MHQWAEEEEETGSGNSACFSAWDNICSSAAPAPASGFSHTAASTANLPCCCPFVAPEASSPYRSSGRCRTVPLPAVAVHVAALREKAAAVTGDLPVGEE